MLGKHRTIWVFGLLLVAALTAGWMWVRYQQEELWGRLPLIFFLSFWGGFVLWRQKKWKYRPERQARWLGLAVLSGVLLALGFPPVPLTPLIFFGFVPLLMVEAEISALEERPCVWEVFRYSYQAFVLWNILTTWWVANTAFFAAILAIWLNSFFMTLPVVLFHLTRKRLPRFGHLPLILYWMAFEYGHLNWPLSWPWLNLGNAFAQTPSWVQWYEWTGTFGGTLWVLGVNVLAFKVFERNGFRFTGLPRREALKVALAVSLPIAVSLVRYFTYEERGRPVEVAVVQPNYEPHYEKFRANPEERRRRFERLSEQVLTPQTEYLVFPETAFGYVRTDRLDREPDVAFLSTLSYRHPNLKIVTGIGAFHIFQEGEPLSPAARQWSQGQDTLYFEVLNAAIQVWSKGDSIPLYRKSKLVPGAEFIPFRQVLFFIEPLVAHLGGSFEGHGTQPEREVFASSTGKVAPVICYESVYGDYHADYVRKGAEAIFIMTNDGWWGNTAGHKQHLRFASLRAIETRRSIARSANTGISAFINQRGDILQPTRYGEEAAIRGTIRFNDGLTFYVRHGDLLARLAAFLSALLLLNLLVVGLRNLFAAPPSGGRKN